jgi:hypothetical protein
VTAVREQPAARPSVRIVHQGGPARMAKVYIDGKEAESAHRVEVVLDANDSGAARAWVEFVDVELDVTADQADQPVIVPAVAGRPWPILIGGSILTLIPAGLAWWMWQLSGWLAATAFVLCVVFGLVWVAGVSGGYVAARSVKGDGDD